MKKLGQKQITGTILLVSGTRIGGSDDLLQIGAVDLTVIKHPTTRKPYLPGSSIKGKMRSEFEKRLGKFSGQGQNEPCGCADCLICRVFGPHKRPNHNLGPSRIIVRDAQLIEGGDIEIKAENIIDRKTGTAQHPRKVERVAAGAKFNFSIAIQYWDLDNDVRYKNEAGADALVEFVKDGLRYLEETGIGSGTSKGYGQIKFQDLRLDGTPFEL
jgi:CRISPR-associated protein Csm3